MTHLLKKQLAITCLLGSISMYAQSQTKLTFTYDASGNQIERKFTSSSKALNRNNEEEQVSESLSDKDIATAQFSNSIKIYPNPTQGNLKLEWNHNFTNSIKEITVTDSGAQKSFQVTLQKEQHYVLVDLTSHASGIYLIHFVLDDTQIIVKKILKN